MPKGYRKNGESLGGRNSTEKARVVARHPDKLRPGELIREPELVQEILRLYLESGWTAQRIAEHIGHPKISKRTVYALAKRARRALRQAQKPVVQKRQHIFVPDTEMPLTAAEGAGCAVVKTQDEVIIPEDVAHTIERSRAFLRQQSQRAITLCDTVFDRAQTAAQDTGDMQLVDAALRAANRAVALVRMVSGIQDAVHERGASEPNRHLHLHLGSSGSFGL